MKRLKYTVRTEETPATLPARILALQAMANLSERQLAQFHYRHASDTLDEMQHRLNDYEDETTAFDSGDAFALTISTRKVLDHLAHVIAIVRESAGQQALPELAPTQSIIWHQLPNLPDDEVRVILAFDSKETDECVFGFRRDDRWYDDAETHLENQTVIAWADAPVFMGKQGGAS